MRRFLLILMVVALIGGGIWFFLIKPQQRDTPNDPPGGSFRSFFSRVNTFSPQSDTESNPLTTEEEVEGANSPFKAITTTPVAGYAVFTRTKTITIPSTDPKQKPTKQTVTEHVLRYVGRSNGYVYEIVDGSKPVQISNIYIPAVYEAFFADSGKTVILRFLRDDKRTIATYSVPIPEPNPDGTRTQLAGTYFPENITNLSISPEGKTLARLTISGDNAVITTSDAKNGASKELIRSPFHSWIPVWQGQTIYLQTKAAQIADGFLYRIDNAGKRLIRTLGPIKGLTTSISPKGSYILYSESIGERIQTKILTVKTGKTKTIEQAILPEKCVWFVNEDLLCAGSDLFPPGTYPDDWYMGTVAFKDTLYRVFTSAGLVETIEESGQYDINSPLIDETRSLLYFIDKETGVLWQFKY